MINLKILRRELLVQIVFSGIALATCLFFVLSEDDQTPLIVFLIMLFFTGIANIIGFLIRTYHIKSKFNKIYGIAVILFLLIAYINFKIEDVIAVYFVGIGSLLLNMYYIYYGYCLIKNNSPDSTSKKS